MNLLGIVRHLFVPHHTNNHHAKILHPASLSVLVALFLGVQVGVNFFSKVSPSVLGFASNIKSERILELVNQRRLENGLNPLRLNSSLNEVAMRKAGDMFAFNYWAHTSPSGRSPWSFFQEVGYNYVYAGENLARDFMDPDSVVAAWVNSPSHRDNLVNRNYQEMGLAIVDGTLGGVETTLVVQVFGTPRSASSAKGAVKKPLIKPALGKASVSVLSQATGEEASLPALLSPFLLTKTLGVFLLGLVFGALIIDLVLVSQKRIIRLSGKNIAHLLFVGTLITAVLMTRRGAIL